MSKQTYLCIYQCFEGMSPHLVNERPGQSYYILYILGAKGLIERSVLVEIQEELFVKFQLEKEKTKNDFRGAESCFLGPFLDLASLETELSFIQEHLGASEVRLLSAQEYNAVLEKMVRLDGSEGHFFEGLLKASRSINHEANKNKRGLLGKIFS